MTKQAYFGRFAARTDIGHVYDHNEDSGYAGPRLLVVADGVGGMPAGERASATAIEVFRQLGRLFGPAPGRDSGHAAAEASGQRPGTPEGRPDPPRALYEAGRRADAALLEHGRQDPSVSGMGTTLTAVLLYDAQLALLHIGDSRAYRLRDGALQRLTHDHTFVQSLIDDGLMTEQEAEKSPQRSVIMRALQGRPDDVRPDDVQTLDVQAGDRILVCCDGLVDAPVNDETIRRTLDWASDPDEAATTLVRLALKAGGPDNVTCLVGDVVTFEVGNGGAAGGPSREAGGPSREAGGPSREAGGQESEGAEVAEVAAAEPLLVGSIAESDETAP